MGSPSISCEIGRLLCGKGVTLATLVLAGVPLPVAECRRHVGVRAPGVTKHRPIVAGKQCVCGRGCIRRLRKVWNYISVAGLACLLAECEPAEEQ